MRLFRVLAVCGWLSIGSVAVARTNDGPAIERMVSLAPHLTELAFVAGAGDRIVGTAEYSDYPQAAQRIARIGDAFRVDYERLLALSPQLVLAWETGMQASTIARIRDLGFRVELFSTQRIADVPREVRRLGNLSRTSEIADRAAQRFEADMSALGAQYQAREPILVFIQVNEQPLYTVNGAQIISEVIELCGGVNAFASLDSFATAVGEEAVIAVDPEVILSVDETVTDPFKRWQRWKQLRAVRARNVFKGPSDNLARPTTRLVEGARAVCELLDTARQHRAQLRAK